MMHARRIVMGIEYDGSGFQGWQWQPEQRTIQSELESALSQVADHPVRVVCSGRTDAGVHALEQVVHFDAEVHRTDYAWVMGTNRHLPGDIRVRFAREISADFHARTSAIARVYHYQILNRPMHSALHRGQLTWVPRPLNLEAMQEAGLCLVGERDFSSFRAKGCQSRSPIRFLHFIRIFREGERVLIEVCANAFLHHMVRNIAGALIEVGIGKRPSGWVKAVLDLKDREQGGVTAPPDGLYFAGVYYPDAFDLPRHPAFAHLPAGARRFTPPPSD